MMKQVSGGTSWFNYNWDFRDILDILDILDIWDIWVIRVDISCFIEVVDNNDH